jgi:activator of 2-hydroxyglutaryl-CoA dehydratase
MPGALGIDFGSVAVKVAYLDAGGRLLGVWSRPILGRVGETLAKLLEMIPRPREGINVRIGVTGSGRELAGGPVSSECEVVALTQAIPALFPDAATAIEIGGHSSRFVVIEPRTRALIDYGLNQQCAAGCGSFLEQQAGRLGLDVETFARLSADAPRGGHRGWSL